ncbi:MAG: LLM class F420-dependent oxidoreductase [Hyphomicrobiaceae bacterium]|nr:LLM class F420-dependent oxidoreductase [Hyphomicrobiaceae bacterium]
MKFALHFSNSNFPDAAGARHLATAAEAAGFESLVVIEHVVWPTNYTSRYPYSPTGRLPGGPDTKLPDPLIWMAFALAATTRLRCMTGILILPQRNPVVLAKELATLDYMSGGRLDLGIGVGWLKEEFEALGVPFEKRGARTDEYIAAMRALWDKDDASYRGSFVSFDGMSCNPKPANGRIPIHIGGHSAAAAKRAAEHGDGFFPATGAQVDIAPIIDFMRKAAAERGRDPSAIEVTTGCPGALPGSGVDPRKAVAETAARGVGRIVVPVTAFITGGPAGATQHARTFGGLEQSGLEERLAEFGAKVIRPSQA